MKLRDKENVKSGTKFSVLKKKVKVPYGQLTSQQLLHINENAFIYPISIIPTWGVIDIEVGYVK